MPAKENIVIIGGGIIGTCSAYYLSAHPSYSPETTSITILEATSIASGASGKAGGLVAKWAYPKELVDVSFEEHLKLARQWDGASRWGWRIIECGEWIGKKIQGNNESSGNSEETPNDDDETLGGNDDSAPRLPSDLNWIKPNLTAAYEPMSAPGSGETMQVHPYQFTTSLAFIAQERGVKVILGRATSVQYSTDDDKTVQGVKYLPNGSDANEETFIPATKVLLSAGAWTAKNGLFPGNLALSGHRAHNITIRPSGPVSAHALFTTINLPAGSKTSQARPEIYPRPNDEVYVCLGGDSPELPLTTADVQVDTKYCDELFEQVSFISPQLANGTVTSKDACFLPLFDRGPRGCPMIGAVEEKNGLYVATGHSYWGISNAPGTGKIISELMLDGKITCGNVKRLEPKKFI